VLTDAIAAEYAWLILKRFFSQTIYRELSFETGPAGLSIRRGSVVLAADLPLEAGKDASQFHDQIGWLVFLQEIWSQPDWDNKHFYESDLQEPDLLREIDQDVRDVVFTEVTDPLPDIETRSDTLQIIYTVGGTVTGSTKIPVQGNLLRASQLRVAITYAAGFELCRAAVREGLLGKPLLGADSLRSRLIASTKKNQDPSSFPADVWRFLEGEKTSSAPRESLTIGRRIPSRTGTSHSRRAVLPATAESELIESARLAGEPVIRPLGIGHLPGQIVYAPEVVSHPDQERDAPSTEGAFAKKQLLGQVYLRDHFESIFAASADPWKYTSDYERVKYEQTLELLPHKQYDNALEIGCAEGHFTQMLAPLVRDLVAADISEIALSRASARCAEFENITYVQLDLTKDPLQGPFELIVCSELLYYVGDQQALAAVIQKIASALRPGGYFLTAHAHLVVDEPSQAGFDWELPFGAKVISQHAEKNPLLCLKKEIWTPLYRVQLFRRPPDPSRTKSLNRPQITKLEKQPTQLLPEITSHVLWNGADKRPDFQEQPITTRRIPILMYHRIAPEGSSVLANYRVTPEAFHDQLRYLSDAGYYSLTLDEWRIAREARQPLPGKPVILTFDDGYSDFKHYAWPVLKRYGFSGTVFLVANQVGKTNRWDAYYGEELPLLDWPDILQLQNEGIEFGSHTANHPHLTGISLSEVVREAAISRKVLQENVGGPITSLAYPYGSTDQVVQHLVGAAGYIYGLTIVPRLCYFHDPLLALPRIEVSGSDDLRQFIQKLPAW
jgi:peptidoglycan/xylan/chitin deacetylase (PgdA/CDA1 family)/SAM-dependent methyltransferase